MDELTLYLVELFNQAPIIQECPFKPEDKEDPPIGIKVELSTKNPLGDVIADLLRDHMRPYQYDEDVFIFDDVIDACGDWKEEYFFWRPKARSLLNALKSVGKAKQLYYVQITIVN